MDAAQFLTKYQNYQDELAGQPTPEQEFDKEQFQSIIRAVGDATTAMLRYLVKNDINANITNFPSEIGTPDVKDLIKAVGRLEKSLKPVKNDNSDVVKSLKSLQSDIQKLPKTLAPKDQVTVSNFGDLTAKIDKMIKAIEAKEYNPEIKVEAPQVTVEPTPVVVQPTDISSVVKSTDKVSDTIKKLKFPVANVPTDPLIYYLPADIDDAGNVQYFGYTDNKGAWYVKKYDTSVSPKTIRLAFGQSNYTTNWTNRASLTYSIWGS